ncbi:MAG: glycosyltransferase family 2 protein, partial [Pseudomonadales bacterium]
MRPKVSVVVPVYNLEFYVERCLASLANQKCKDIEVLVVNDGGTDDSQLIIDEYVEKWPGI